MSDTKKIDEFKIPLSGKAGVYFIGIGGIGMSALAKFFHAHGVKVAGYDKTATILTKEMETMGIAIHYDENVNSIPKDAELVVFTPAVPKEHAELLYFQQHGYRVVKRSDVLQMITSSSFNVCIAGTHGKTTTTTMVAHLLTHSGYGCNAFLGGISVNYGTNYLGSSRNVCVVEADEYDRSFLKLEPDIAVISSMDPDHLDIYGTPEAVEQGFIDFSEKIKPGGTLISKFGLKRGKELKATKKLTYSLQNNSADAYAANIKMIDGSYEFDAMLKDNMLDKVQLNMGGMHNVENAIAAITVASSLGIANEKIKAAIASFKGVKRRFEYIIKSKRIVFIDDYAHHPEELRALINGAKSLFKERKCTMIFQPHLFSRTQDQADGFAEVLDQADEVILLPIYPARELPIPGVNSNMIVGKMKNRNARVMEKQELVDWIEKVYKKEINSEFGNVLVTAGAGDIDLLVEPIRDRIGNN